MQNGNNFGQRMVSPLIILEKILIYNCLYISTKNSIPSDEILLLKFICGSLKLIFTKKSIIQKFVTKKTYSYFFSALFQFPPNKQNFLDQQLVFPLNFQKKYNIYPMRGVLILREQILSELSTSSLSPEFFKMQQIVPILRFF